MGIDDIPAVMEVERQSFTMPWPAHAYRRELKENQLARYIVARRTGPDLAFPDPARAVSQAREVPPQQGMWRGLLNRLGRWLAGGAEPVPARRDNDRRVAGYAGLWLMVDEAHVTSIAVAPPYRGLGAGELLFLGLIEVARSMGGQYMTLEVRASNTLAQNLYRKYGFKETGVRRKYYSDNNEDALIMWSDPLESRAFLRMVEEHRRALLERLRSTRLQTEPRARSAQA